MATDPEVPEADAAEQQTPADPDDADLVDTSDFEKPEADVGEQLRSVKPGRALRMSDDPEAPEADRLEQAQEVPLGDGE